MLLPIISFIIIFIIAIIYWFGGAIWTLISIRSEDDAKKVAENIGNDIKNFGENAVKEVVTIANSDELKNIGNDIKNFGENAVKEVVTLANSDATKNTIKGLGETIKDGLMKAGETVMQVGNDLVKAATPHVHNANCKPRCKQCNGYVQIFDDAKEIQIDDEIQGVPTEFNSEIYNYIGESPDSNFYLAQSMSETA